MATNTTSNSTTIPNNPNQGKIARIITWFVLCGSSALAIAAIVVLVVPDVYSVDKWNAIKDIFTMMLPVWGTWIGTILAFYFSKDNFESASKSMNDLVKTVTSEQKLKSINVKDAMRPLASIKGFTFTSQPELDATKIKAILDKMKQDQVFRMPFMDSNNVLKYCFHKSTFDSFIVDETVNNGKPAAELTFKDMLSSTNPEIKKYATGRTAEFVKENATLLDAKIIMDQNPLCLDVFVTATGADNEPVIGWITNDKLLENSKV